MSRMQINNDYLIGSPKSEYLKIVLFFQKHLLTFVNQII